MPNRFVEVGKCNGNVQERLKALGRVKKPRRGHDPTLSKTINIVKSHLEK